MPLDHGDEPRDEAAWDEYTEHMGAALAHVFLRDAFRAGYVAGQVAGMEAAVKGLDAVIRPGVRR